MPYEKADAITIRSVDYSETSRILTFYTRQFGRISALAKGARRKYSKLIGHIDLLSYSEIVFVSGRMRDRLHILTEACAFEAFPNIRRDLPRFYAACHAAELVNATTAEDDPNPKLFDEFLALLRRLEGGVGGRQPRRPNGGQESLSHWAALFAFEARLLVLSGFMPEVSACVVCGKPNREKTINFSPRLGGIICAQCSPGEGDVLRDIPSGALALLGRLAQGKATKLDRITISPGAAAQVRAFLNRYESYVLGRELRTLKHL